MVIRFDEDVDQSHEDTPLLQIAPTNGRPLDNASRPLASSSDRNGFSRPKTPSWPTSSAHAATMTTMTAPQPQTYNAINAIPRPSVRRRTYLLLTDPRSSPPAAIFGAALILTVLTTVGLVLVSTMDAFQQFPEECDPNPCTALTAPTALTDLTALTDMQQRDPDVPCQCPPEPTDGLVPFFDACMVFLTVELVLRLLTFEPPPATAGTAGTAGTAPAHYATWSFLQQYSSFLFDPSTLIDILATFPYWMNLRQFPIFRLAKLVQIFALARLDVIEGAVQMLGRVCVRAKMQLGVLLLVLGIGAIFFGTAMYYVEQGDWTFVADADPPSFMYVRSDGNPSPFTSIPAAIWWFMATVTTVGYGDYYPISAAGRCIATVAMLGGLLVIAYPVSVFTELWSEEMHVLNISTRARNAGDKDCEGDNDDVEEDDGVQMENMTASDIIERRRNAYESFRYSGQDGEAGAIQSVRARDSYSSNARNGTSGGKRKRTIDADDLAQLVYHVRKAQEIIEKMGVDQ